MEKLYLIVRTNDRFSMGGHALEMSVEVCTVRDGAPRGLGCDGRALDQLAFADIAYSDHPDWKTLGALTTRTLYAPSIADLRGIVKLADSIGRKLSKVEETAGPSATFGAAVLRFGAAVGAVGFIRKVKDTRDEWTVGDLKAAGYYVDSIVAEFRAKHAPVTAAA